MARCIPPPTVPEYVADKWTAFRFHYTPSVSTILSLTHTYILLLHTYIFFAHAYILLLHTYIFFAHAYIFLIHTYITYSIKCISVCVQIHKCVSENI